MGRDNVTHRPLQALVLIPGLLVLWATPALGQGRFFHLPPQAVEVAPGTFDLGVARDVDGRAVRGFAFVHPRRGFGHKPGHGPGGGGGSSRCFAFLANGARWKTVEPYLLDPTNTDGVSPDDLAAWTALGLAAWETGAGVPIFGDLGSGTVDGADEMSPDGKNEILFGSIAQAGAVAVTIVWGVFSGPPFARELVEWDMVFDDVDFQWGNAGATSETAPGDTSVMDFWNVFTHEAGHAAGLAHPSETCTEATMYRFTQEGETKKRTLNAGDMAGIQALY